MFKKQVGDEFYSQSWLNIVILRKKCSIMSFHFMSFLGSWLCNCGIRGVWQNLFHVDKVPLYYESSSTPVKKNYGQF